MDGGVVVPSRTGEINDGTHPGRAGEGDLRVQADLEIGPGIVPGRPAVGAHRDDIGRLHPEALEKDLHVVRGKAAVEREHAQGHALSRELRGEIIKLGEVGRRMGAPAFARVRGRWRRRDLGAPSRRRALFCVRRTAGQKDPDEHASEARGDGEGRVVGDVDFSLVSVAFQLHAERRLERLGGPPERHRTRGAMDLDHREIPFAGERLDAGEIVRARCIGGRITLVRPGLALPDHVQGRLHERGGSRRDAQQEHCGHDLAREQVALEHGAVNRRPGAALDVDALAGHFSSPSGRLPSANSPTVVSA